MVQGVGDLARLGFCYEGTVRLNQGILGRGGEGARGRNPRPDGIVLGHGREVRFAAVTSPPTL